MIKKLYVKNFKRFRSQEFNILPLGVSLFVGGNNSGKSTVIHALAIWEFCKMILSHEKGDSVFLATNVGKDEGFGMSSDDFLPVAVPSLNHFWTNLKVQIPTKSPHAPNDKFPGYTLRISCFWDTDIKSDLFLEIGLSLVNDRLFMRVTDTNLGTGDYIPKIVYLPTFAGVLPKERKSTIAERRAFLGQGMAGSILRNLIYDLYDKEEDMKIDLLNGKSRLSKLDKDYIALNSSFAHLQSLLREVFSVELEVMPFNDEFQTILHVDERKVTFNNGEYKAIPKSKYTPRDIMLQGSGFLQWTSIFCILFNENVDVLLLDEPDAHLHTTLQIELFKRLEKFTKNNLKQIILSTHSVDMIKQAKLSQIFSMDKLKYLSDEQGRVGILSGIGNSYFPQLYKLQEYKKVIFVENESDKNILSVLGNKVGIPFPSDVVIWETTSSHSERILLFKELKKNIPDLRGISLRDRDLESIEVVSENLRYKSIRYKDNPDILCLQWRRRNIESYLLCPQAIALASKRNVTEIKDYFKTKQALHIDDEGYIESLPPENVLILDGKKIFTMQNIGLEILYNCNKYDVAKEMRSDWVCNDIKIFLQEVKDHLK